MKGLINQLKWMKFENWLRLGRIKYCDYSLVPHSAINRFAGFDIVIAEF